MIVGLADRSNLLNDEFRLIALDEVSTFQRAETLHHAPCVASVFPEIHLVLTSAFAIVQNEPQKNRTEKCSISGKIDQGSAQLAHLEETVWISPL